MSTYGNEEQVNLDLKMLVDSSIKKFTTRSELLKNKFTDKLITIKVPAIIYTTDLKKYNSHNHIKKRSKVFISSNDLPPDDKSKISSKSNSRDNRYKNILKYTEINNLKAQLANRFKRTKRKIEKGNIEAIIHKIQLKLRPNDKETNCERNQKQVLKLYFEGMQIKLEDNLLMVETIADEPLQQIATTINTKYENSYNQTQVQTPQDYKFNETVDK